MPERSHLTYRKSSYSTGRGQDCVEVADLPGGGASIRDNKHRDLGALELSRAEWAALLTGLRIDQ